MPAERKRSAPWSHGHTLAREETQGVVISLKKVSFSLQLTDADSSCCCSKQSVAHLDKSGLIGCFGGDMALFESLTPDL